MFYYVVSVKDNKEFTVKNNIEQKLKKIQCFIPFSKDSISFAGIKIQFFTRLLPNYIVLKTEERLTKPDLETLSTIQDIEKLLTETIKNGTAPAELTEQEAKPYTKDFDYNSIYNLLDGELFILGGSYSGKTCKIKTKKDDFYNIIVNTRKNPEMKQTIWSLGKAEVK